MSHEDVLSIQLYSLRKYGDLEGQIDLAARAGFRQVETIGSHHDDAAATRRMLDARGLRAPTGHFAMQGLRDRLDWVVDVAGTLGIGQVIMPAMPPDQRRLDAAGWRAVGAELGDIAARLADRGLRFGYHNHDWELARVEDGRTGLDLLFEAAGDRPLGWEVDAAWLARGGADPAAEMRRYADRILACHVKDIAPAGRNQDEDGWADVGAGVLPWPALWQEARQAGAEWMIVEHDNPRDFEGFLRRSFTYANALPG